MTQKKRKLTDYISILSMILLSLAAASGVLNVIFVFNPGFADWFNQNISSHVRNALAVATGWIPFSLAEFFVLGSVFIAVLAVILTLKLIAKRKTRFIKAVIGILSVFGLVYTVFVFSTVAGYRGTGLDSKLGLEKREVSVRELSDTASLVADELNEIYDEYGDMGFLRGVGTVRPFSHSECVEKLRSSYFSLRKQYPFISDVEAPVKILVSSELMTYTHISGVYTFLTGEANLNTNYPNFVNVFTTAHEMAHQRGVEKEDEANFTAFLVCINSDDPYIRYCGYLNMFEYLGDAIYGISKAEYGKVYSKLNEGARADLMSYSRFFERYRNSKAAQVTDAVNDAYLRSQGTEGTASYGLVVDLCVAYYRQNDR